MIGKRNSGFEIADGLLPWARQVVLVSPAAGADLRARALVRAGALHAAARGRRARRRHVRPRRRGRADRAHRRTGSASTRRARPARATLELEADAAIAATGFSHAAPRSPGSRRADGRAGTHPGADAVLGGDRRAGDLLRRETRRRARRDCGSTASARARRRCTGFRYNARVARRARSRRRHFGVGRSRALAVDDVVPFLGARARARARALDAEGLPDARRRARRGRPARRRRPAARALRGRGRPGRGRRDDRA